MVWRVQCSGTVPSSFCALTNLGTLGIWASGRSSTNPAITCTRSCLSSKINMNYMSSLPMCPATTISLDTQRGICAFIAATNIASIYSTWACDVYGQVITQPCTGGTITWLGIKGCSSNGDVTAINLSGKLLSGMSSPCEFTVVVTVCNPPFTVRNAFWCN